MKKPNKSTKSSRPSKPTKIPNIDPTTVATIWHSMQTICKEMRHMVKRTAQNYLIGQLQDMSVGIWGADGTTIAVDGVVVRERRTRHYKRSPATYVGVVDGPAVIVGVVVEKR